MHFSRKNKFCFMHINKTGGKSLEAVLSTFVPDFKLSSLGIKAIHKPYWWLNQKGLIQEGYRIVTIVRNPAKRYESLYRYRRMKYDQIQEFKAVAQDKFRVHPSEDKKCTDAYEMDFIDWFRLQLKSDNPLDLPQVSWLPESDYVKNNMFFLRLEHLEADTLEFLHSLPYTDIFDYDEFPKFNESPKMDLEWDLQNTLELFSAEQYLYKRFYPV